MQVASFSERVLYLSYIEVIGKRRLCGEIDLQGSKNSALPILAATVICGGECVLHNCPMISDVCAAIEILRELGCRIKTEESTVIIDSAMADKPCISYDLMRKMRSSIVFLGAMLSRFKTARLSFPGGCELGPRPIDIHISAIKALGVTVNEKHGILDCTVKTRIKGTDIHLDFPSVGATENIMLTSVISNGTTVIKNAAREPEIIDLAEFLNSCGAKIKGAGESEITVTGVDRLFGTEHRVISDRIAAVTYMCAAAVTNGDVLLNKTDVCYLTPVLQSFENSGCRISYDNNKIRLIGNDRLCCVPSIRTMPYPGFPTDAQPLLLAMMTVANGSSMFIETIFQCRYKFVGELRKFGADIKVEGNVAVVNGVKGLYGARVDCTDLRGGAAVLIAALCAEGKSEIYCPEHIYRGYENIEENLCFLGADVLKKEV